MLELQPAVFVSRRSASWVRRLHPAGAKNLFIHSGMSPPDALRRAYASIYRTVQAQATTLAYIDTFKVLAVISAVMFVLSFVLRKNEPGGGGEVAVG